MTEQTHGNEHSEQAAGEAERIATTGENVRERIREAVTRLIRERRLTLDEMTTLGGSVLDGAVAGVRDLAPQERESALRQVVDGLADAFERTANATRLAMQESAARGQAFTREEVDRTVSDLRELQKRFVNVLTRVTNQAARQLGDQVESINSHIRRTAESIQPSIESALRVAMDHPVKLAGETAAAGVRAVPKAAGLLLSAVGGLLQGAGDALAGSRHESDPPAKE